VRERWRRAAAVHREAAVRASSSKQRQAVACSGRPQQHARGWGRQAGAVGARRWRPVVMAAGREKIRRELGFRIDQGL